MNIKDIVNEDLGNLATLNVGPLINVLKQQVYSGHRQSSAIGPVGSKFHGYNIGSTSEIRDVGVLKKGIASLRKAFKDNERANGFAVYIGGHAVMFGITDPHSLAGSSRESRVAYDLTRYKDIIDRMYPDNYRKPAATTARTKERYGIDRDNTQRRYVGDLIDTGKLSSMLDLIQAIGAETNQPVTAKLVMRDTEAEGKRDKRRLTRQEIEAGTKDLRTRLAIYKNSKKPTVDTIEDFIAMSLKNPGSSVKFAGTTYSLKASSYESINPLNLLGGATFTTSYRSMDPGSHDSLTLTYKYDRETNQLIPIKASWIDRTDPVRRYVSQEAILEPKLYLVDKLKTRRFEKDVVIPKLLQMFKDRNYYELTGMLESLVRLGLDWPELAAIRKSLAAVKAEKNP